MDCKSVRDRFSSLWEKELASADEKEMREHLSSCPECRREFEQFQKTMRWLHSVEEAEVPDGFLPELRKKIEERKNKVTGGERSTGGWFRLPTSVRLPVQAVAMVAIVFLVLYLTKMMPTEIYHMEESKQTSSLPSLERKSDQALVQKGGEKESKDLEKPDETQRPKDVNQIAAPAPAKERGEAPAPGMKAEGGQKALERPAEIPRLKDADRLGSLAPTKERPQAPPLQMRAEAKKEEAPSPKSEIVAHQAFDSKEQEKAKAPSAEPEMAGKGLLATKKSVVTSTPPQEIILRISDREKVVSRLQELIKQFKGEVVATEGNMFVASIPTGSFSGFEKEVVELGSTPKADKMLQEKQATGSLRAAPAASRVKREDAPKHIAGAEGRTTVRILLIQE